MSKNALPRSNSSIVAFVLFVLALVFGTYMLWLRRRSV